MLRVRFFIVIIAILSFSFACWASEVKISFEPQKIYQGKTLAVYVKSERSYDEAQVLFLDKRIKCHFVDGKFRGLIGVPPEQKPGKYKIKIVLAGNGQLSREIEKTAKILPARFAATWFRLKPAKKRLYVRELIQEEWAKIEKTLVVNVPEQRWDDKFVLPVSGRISMNFGTVEHINGKKTGQHRGLDLAVPSRTPVKAPEKGKIVFAEMLKAFGGTVVLDHGQGIHSLYFHLSKVLKNLGEMVDEGEVIALSGNSGISTGPHLHWGMSVNNVRVDPLQWTKTAFQ